MKHFSFTGDPAITCFSCSPSTDTEGTEVQIFISQLIWTSGVTVTDNPQFEDLTDLGTGGHLTFKLSRITGVGEFKLERVLSSPSV